MFSIKRKNSLRNLSYIDEKKVFNEMAPEEAEVINGGRIIINKNSLRWRQMVLWQTPAIGGLSCKDACRRGYCLGAYVDNPRADKKPCNVRTPNKNCICVGVE